MKNFKSIIKILKVPHSRFYLKYIFEVKMFTKFDIKKKNNNYFVGIHKILLVEG